MKPAFKKTDSVTASNSSGINDFFYYFIREYYCNFIDFITYVVKIHYKSIWNRFQKCGGMVVLVVNCFINNGGGSA